METEKRPKAADFPLMSVNFFQNDSVNIKIYANDCQFFEIFKWQQWDLEG